MVPFHHLNMTDLWNIQLIQYLLKKAARLFSRLLLLLLLQATFTTSCTYYYYYFLSIMWEGGKGTTTTTTTTTTKTFLILWVGWFGCEGHKWVGEPGWEEGTPSWEVSVNHAHCTPSSKMYFPIVMQFYIQEQSHISQSQSCTLHTPSSKT